MSLDNKALRMAASLLEGQEDSAVFTDGEQPSAVICYPSSEEGLAAEVKSVRALALNSVFLTLVPSPNLRLAPRSRREPAGFSTIEWARSRSSGPSA